MPWSMSIRWRFISRSFIPSNQTFPEASKSLQTKRIFLYYVFGMYKSNSNFGAGCPNWADWADLRFGIVHSTGIMEQNKSVYHNQDTSMHIWWIGIEKLFLKRYLITIGTYKSSIKGVIHEY